MKQSLTRRGPPRLTLTSLVSGYALVRRRLKPVTTCLTFLTLINIANTFAETKVTGTFSSFRISERSGDIVGMELHIVPDPTGYSVVVQGSEGAPGFPESYIVTVQGNEITFNLPESANCGLPPGNYRAKIELQGLHLIGPY